MVGVGNVPHHTNVCVFRLGRVVMLHVNVRVVLLGVGILGAVFSGGMVLHKRLLPFQLLQDVWSQLLHDRLKFSIEDASELVIVIIVRPLPVEDPQGVAHHLAVKLV